jgi:hypothetical protein
MNIFSGSRDGNGLAAALTNPTGISLRKGTIRQTYPVVIYGKEFIDAETAFFALCKQARATTDTEVDQVMLDIIVAKFQQHPRLLAKVSKLGGLPLGEALCLCVCEMSAAFKESHAYGRESRFIRNLIAAYERAAGVAR